MTRHPLRSSSRKGRRPYPGSNFVRESWIPALRFAPAGMTAESGMSAATCSVILGAPRSGDPGDPSLNRLGFPFDSPQADEWIPGTARKRGPRMTAESTMSAATHAVSSPALCPGSIGPQRRAARWIAGTSPAMTAAGGVRPRPTLRRSLSQSERAGVRRARSAILWRRWTPQFGSRS